MIIANYIAVPVMISITSRIKWSPVLTIHHNVLYKVSEVESRLSNSSMNHWSGGKDKIYIIVMHAPIGTYFIFCCNRAS